MAHALMFPFLLLYLSCAEIQRELPASLEGLDRRWAQDVSSLGAPRIKRRVCFDCLTHTSLKQQKAVYYEL